MSQFVKENVPWMALMGYTVGIMHFVNQYVAQAHNCKTPGSKNMGAVADVFNAILVVMGMAYYSMLLKSRKKMGASNTTYLVGLGMAVGLLITYMLLSYFTVKDEKQCLPTK